MTFLKVSHNLNIYTFYHHFPRDYRQCIGLSNDNFDVLWILIQNSPILLLYCQLKMGENKGKVSPKQTNWGFCINVHRNVYTKRASLGPRSSIGHNYIRKQPDFFKILFSVKPLNTWPEFYIILSAFSCVREKVPNPNSVRCDQMFWNSEKILTFHSLNYT